MKISTSALCYIVLAAVLGSQASVIPDPNTREIPGHVFDPTKYENGLYLGDCCFTYDSGKIPCSLVEETFLTEDMCSRPGIILSTKTGKHICANPKDERVEGCMTVLKFDFNN